MRGNLTRTAQLPERRRQPERGGLRQRLRQPVDRRRQRRRPRLRRLHLRLLFQALRTARARQRQHQDSQPDAPGQSPGRLHRLVVGARHLLPERVLRRRRHHGLRRGSAAERHVRRTAVELHGRLARRGRPRAHARRHRLLVAADLRQRVRSAERSLLRHHGHGGRVLLSAARHRQRRAPTTSSPTTWSRPAASDRWRTRGRSAIRTTTASATPAPTTTAASTSTRPSSRTPTTWSIEGGTNRTSGLTRAGHRQRQPRADGKDVLPRLRAADVGELDVRDGPCRHHSRRAGSVRRRTAPSSAPWSRRGRPSASTERHRHATTHDRSPACDARHLRRCCAGASRRRGRPWLRTANRGCAR